MTEATAKKRLAKFVAGYKSQSAAAKDLRITRQQLNDIIKREGGVSAVIASRIGLQLHVKTTRTYTEVA